MSGCPVTGIPTALRGPIDCPPVAFHGVLTARTRRDIPRSRGKALDAMDSLRWALPWLMVVAVGLAPMLIYWVGSVIGRAVHRNARQRAGSALVPTPDGEQSHEGDSAPRV